MITFRWELQLEHKSLHYIIAESALLVLGKPS
jgi:hypothetical protein